MHRQRVELRFEAGLTCGLTTRGVREWDQAVAKDLEVQQQQQLKGDLIRVTRKEENPLLNHSQSQSHRVCPTLTCILRTNSFPYNYNIVSSWKEQR